ncbi:hypothetical protein JCM16303_004181 [Sporobolomyces ruberrimus]
MSSSGEQQLLYSLRSPTTPLNDKLALAVSSLSTRSSTSSDTSALSQLIRDWLLDTLFKLVRSSSNLTEQALLNGQLWELLSSTTEATLTSSTSTPVLPIYLAFIQTFTKSDQKDARLLKDAARIWSKLASNGMRKATVDAVLDGYDKLVKSTVELYEAGNEGIRADWEELAVVWLKAIKSVLSEAAKGGKKVPSHTLSLLPSLVPLLAQLDASSPLRLTLLQTTQLALFNLDNLRRGLARDSYASGGAPTAQTSTTTADSELLASLSALPTVLHTPLYAALPSLTHIYLTSLSTNSAALFPLPAKATFPTPSAQKSALEVLGLGKRRELAGRWVKGIVELTAWTASGGSERETEKARALALVLAEVEKGDLYRPGQGGEVWEGVLPSITKGAVERLEGISTSDAARRDATLEVLSSVHRLEYEVLDQELPRILAVLSRTPAASEPSPSTSTFLSLLLVHHSRSLTMPTLLSLLSDALASSPYVAANNLLTTTSFTTQLGRSINGMLSSSASIRSTWENLLSPITSILHPSFITSEAMSIDQDDATNGVSITAENNPSPAKKRKLSSTVSNSDPNSLLSAGARIRILTTFITHLPTPGLASLLESFKSFMEEIVDSNLKDFVQSATSSKTTPEAEAEGTPSKKSKKSKRKSVGGAVSGSGSPGIEPVVTLGVELLEARYAIVSRLNAAGLLPSEAEEGGGWASSKNKLRDGLREAVEKGTKEAVVVSARILLQQLEIAGSPISDTSSILSAILARLETSAASSSWSGNMRGVRDDQVAIVLWEMISRRWMVLFDSLASEEQLKQMTGVISESLVGETIESRDAITRRLLKRADFWELSSLQAQLRPTLLRLASLPSLESPATLLPLLSGASPSKELSSLKSLPTPTLLAAANTFSRLASFMPLEYLGREFRSQFADRALSLDLWISTGAAEVSPEEKEAAQTGLRTFVAYMGSVVDQAPQVLAQLVRNTTPGAKAASLALYRALIQTSLSTFSDSKSPAELLSFLQAFEEKPLSDLAKRAKKDEALSQGLSCEESAYVLLLELLATNLGDVSSVPADLSTAVRASFKASSKPFGKAIGSVTAARTTVDPFAQRDLLEATRAMWTMKDWLGGAADDQDALYAELLQMALTTTISQLPSSISKPSALPTCVSLVELLSYRIKRLRALAGEGKVSTQPFETLIASHYLFRQSFGVTASTAFDQNLVKATAQATIAEYSVALEGISSAISSVTSSNDYSASTVSLQASLSMAMVLLRDGPEGSVKLSSSAFSELLRYLSLLVENVASRPEQDDQTAKVYLLVATFLDGVCADRPMLLSRLNVSSVLALVSRILQPSPAATPTASPMIPETASLLLRTLASTVGHIVRHRKDHVVPLFPQLVTTLSAFLSTLRRAGFGSTGSSASIEEADTGIILGQRAEREARATFPAWVWQGGVKGVNQGEAAAVGRLLGSLTAKTTAIQHKNHKQQRTNEDGSSSTTTTSLTAPLSKHAPFLLLAYLRACVHPTCPIPSALRGELQGGWFEVMDSMGKWEREALMKGFLGEDEEAERGVLRELWKNWEKERYRG